MSTGAAKFILKEADLSIVAGGIDGITAAMVLPTARGDVDVATFCASESAFLQNFTVSGNSIPVGADLSMFSAANYLARSNSLWVARATVDNMYYGSMVLPAEDTALTYGTSPAASLSNPEDRNFNANELALIHGVNPGDWNKYVAVKIVHNSTYPTLYTFDILVYVKGVLEETWTVSRLAEAKDGFGQSMYISNVLSASSYIRAINNGAIDSTIRPRETSETTTTTTGPVVTQAYSAAVDETAQSYSFTVTSGNVSGVSQTIDIDGEIISIPATDLSADQVAATIAAYNWAGSVTSQAVSASVLANVVTLTDDPLTTNTGAVVLGRSQDIRALTPTLSRNYSPAVAEQVKVVNVPILTGNTSGVDETLTLLGVATAAIPGGSTIDVVGTAVAAGVYPATVTSVTYNTGIITITMAAGTGLSLDGQYVPTGGVTITVGTPVTTQGYVAPALEELQQAAIVVTNGADLVDEDWTITFDGVDQTFSVVDGTSKTALVTQVSGTAVDGAMTTAGVNAYLVGNTSDVLLVEFTAGIQDVSLLSFTVPSTVSLGTVTTYDYVAPVAAVPQIQSLTFTSGNTSISDERIVIDGREITLSIAENTPTLAAAHVVAQNLQVSNVNIDSTSNVAGVVDITFTLAAGSADLVTVVTDVYKLGIALTEGSDGDPISASSMIAALDKFKNKDITIFLDGGRESVAYKKALAALAEKRKDSVAILTVPLSKQKGQNWLNQVLDFRNIELNLNTSYAALYFPHLKATDKYNNRELWLSPDGYVGGIHSTTRSNYTPWAAAAGPVKGAITSVTDTYINIDISEADILVNAQINPILNIEGKGINIWDEMTLYAQPSDLQDLHVRFLLIVIEKAVQPAFEAQLFEAISEGQEDLLKTVVDDFMQPIADGLGVYEWKTETESSPQTNEMKVKLFLKPVKQLKYITFQPVLTAYNLDFSTASGLV